jgi:hypothetical protein
LDEEKSKCAGLAQEIGFSPPFLYSLVGLVKGTAKANNTLAALGPGGLTIDTVVSHLFRMAI